jgi:hypothetical protein
MKSNNNRILTIAVVLLLIANIALVALMVTGQNRQDKNGMGRKGDPFEMMEKELNMTAEPSKTTVRFCKNCQVGLLCPGKRQCRYRQYACCRL